ncbi:MAG TPA: phenylalanine--tRNA ligase subunit beta [Candidatus Dormibacteraeota bacterium]|nr:phenylalanine--tRNA ligase subunit beta [Candidatus Dormibacteraeota bacterium]
MRVSQEWLQAFVDLDGLTPRRIAELLTLSGTEVERIVDFAPGLDQLVVAEVVELGRLEGSDHLWMTKVRVPGEDPLEVVCGAPNLTLGAVVAWARPGTVLPGGLELGQKRIRGALSNGMICAPDELGLGQDHEGVLLLPGSEAELGQPLSRLFPKDTIYELEILSHRADCLSHWGVARELAAVLDRPLREPELSDPTRDGPPSLESVQVRIEANSDCPIYLAECVDQIGSGPAPLWMQRRLMAVGSRSISAVVDLANYVMLELGQPVHTFDLDRLPGAPGLIQIGVRHGRGGERLSCLDGVVRTIDQEALLITAGDQAVAFAGVIGGSETAVQPSTTRVVLEVANFNWVSIRRTTRRLGIRTEASSRYERSLAPALVPIAARRFIHLVGEVAGGRVRPGPVGAGAVPGPEEPIQVSSRGISGLLGLEVSPDQAAGALRRLQFSVDVSGEQLRVKPLALRTDVRIPADLTEEVGRILGYDLVPATLPSQRTPPSGHPGQVSAARLAGEICLGAGFTEAITSSLVNQERAGLLQGLGEGMVPLRIENPLSSQLGDLRVSCLPMLVEACRLNQSRGKDRTQLFEWGRVFWPTGNRSDRPEEPELLALVDHSGGTEPGDSAEALDLLLQVVQALGERVSLQDLEFRPAKHPGFHPHRSSGIWVEGELRGVVGEVALGFDSDSELRGTTVAAEMRVDGWLVDGGRPGRGASLAKTPPLSLDLAVIVPAQAELGPALTAVRAAGITGLEEIKLVDQYRGAQLPAGTKGWTFRLVFRHPEKTLTHRQGEQLREEVLSALGAVGAAVRTGSA